MGRFWENNVFFKNRLFVYASANQTKPDILLLVYCHLCKQAEEFCTYFISLSGSGMLLCLTPENFRSLALTVCDLWYYEDILGKGWLNELMNEWMNQ